ncbi:hypothetical protein [Haloarcula pelagica]|uniref:hypothetical protein n=1 Tax=Haloarcula pelagica TaxID=3033389 RepID=UPI0024C2E715|nr:hypothetical protein [Halomicroarcula sp. YJ-61-S]
MSERTEERTREADTTTDADTGVDIGGLGGTATERQPAEEAESSGSYFSARALLFAFAATGGGMVAGSLVPVIPFTALLGIPAGAFVYGLLTSERRYVETGLAGGLVAGVGTVLSVFSQLALRGVAGGNVGAGRLFLVAAALGLVASLVAHYFGRDLRSGLTADLS